MLGDDNYTLADSYTLADDFTFERLNPDSVWSCFYLGRENARQMRHCISSEMWTSLNLAYLRLQQLSIQEIWKVSPENFYAETASEIHTFTGVTEVTMYRDEGWHFWRLGRFAHRAGPVLCRLISSSPCYRPANAEIFRAGLDQPLTFWPGI